MDERFRGKGLWVGLGLLAVIFLCLMLCGLGALSMFTTRSGPVYVQPPAGEEGAVPPSTYPGHGVLGMGRYDGWQPFGILGFGISMLFKLLFFGLLLLLFVGLIRRIFWGHRWWGPPRGHKPPQGKEWKGRPHAWGPWAWHWHGEYGPAEDDLANEEGAPDTPNPAPGEAA
jgi:hypothetical protein